MSCLGQILARVVSRCLHPGLGFGVSFSHDGRVLVLQAWYQHPMSNQQRQRTEGTTVLPYKLKYLHSLQRHVSAHHILPRDAIEIIPSACRSVRLIVLLVTTVHCVKRPDIITIIQGGSK